MNRLSMKLFATSTLVAAVLLNVPGAAGGNSLSPFASASPLPDDQQLLAQQDASLWLGLGDGPEEEHSLLSQSEKAEGIDDEEVPLELSEMSA